MNPTTARLFGSYAACHRTDGNVRCHSIGIPLIAFGLAGLLAVPLFSLRGIPVELALLLVLILLPVQMWLDVRLGALVTAAYVVFYLLGRMLPWPVLVLLFVLGWVVQFFGHGHYEKKSPAFLANLAHLLVGPLWLLNHWFPGSGGAPEDTVR